MAWNADPVKRDVSCTMTLGLSGRFTKVVTAIAAAAEHELESETIDITVDGRPVPVTELLDEHGTRLHQFVAEGSEARVHYAASTATVAPAPEVTELDLVKYLRPSRYCESDTIGPIAATEFPGLGDGELLDAVADWMAERFTYTAGSSKPTDGALQTLINREGVCRDYAHVSTAFLRALNVPARIVGCYAPGLSPMEFHAVTEAYVDGGWHVLDGTRLAPRPSLLRVATGRDAADIAFLSNYGGPVQLLDYQVMAVADELPFDDFSQRLHLQ